MNTQEAYLLGRSDNLKGIKVQDDPFLEGYSLGLAWWVKGWLDAELGLDKAYHVC